MRTRLKNVAILVFVLVFMPIAWVTVYQGPDVSQEELLEKRLAELRERLHHAEGLSQERENDIHVLRNQLHVLLGTHTHGNQTEEGRVQVPLEARLLLANMSLGASDMQPPGLLHYLPHLIGHPEGLKPALKLSQGRTGVSIVIGVPTIKRERESYLIQTLASLIESLNDEEKRDCLIVVFVGEYEDTSYAGKVAKELQKTFHVAFDQGLLEMIAPNPLYYPNINNLKETFGDSKERVKWRTKQNLDFSFLMMYARSRGTYYCQLEDDIMTKPGYLSTMKNFALNQKSEEWILLEFSHLGFIGKLFKSSDLPMVVEFFLMFHRDKPIDWLLDHLLYVKVCNPEKDNKHCQRSIAEMRRRFKPSLFQHIGTHSSLKGKVQKLKDKDFRGSKFRYRYGHDKDFGKPPMHRAHINPNAEVSSTLKVYQRFSLDRAYMGETFFWGLIPKAGDILQFKFQPPILIEKYVFRSGNPEHPGDKFYNTTVEVLPEEHVSKQSGVLDNSAHSHPFPRTEDGFLIIGNFSQVSGAAENDVDAALGKINTLRLRVLTGSESWVVLNEIYIKTRAKR